MQRKKATPEYWQGRLRHRPSDGFYDCEQQHRKERHRVTLKARTEKEAEMEAAKVWLDIHRHGWDEFDIGDPPLSKFVPWVVDKLQKRGASPKTTNQYETGLWSLMRRQLGLDGAHKFGRKKSRDKRAERALLGEYRVSFLTPKLVKKWRRLYPTQALAASYLFQPDILVESPWRIKRPLPFRRPGEGNLAQWYPRPW